MMKKSNNIDRRTFLTRSLLGLGAIGLSEFANPFVKTTIAAQGKKLIATTDYNDNLAVNYNGTRYGTPKKWPDEFYKDNRYFMDRAQLDDLHRELASMGVTRHQFMYNPRSTYYENYPHGFDLLAEVADSAHKYGLEIYNVIKPFENGGFAAFLPTTMPFPEHSDAFKDLRGICPGAWTFAAEHPEMNLKRKPGTPDVKGPVTAIRLIKSDNRNYRISQEHISIWSSASNNNFVEYTGPVKYEETVLSRYRFPYWRQCNALVFSGLQLPENHKYILIKCSLADSQGNFSNEYGNILELLNQDGEIIPHTMGKEPVDLKDHMRIFKSDLQLKQIRYLQNPLVQAEINNPERMKYHYNDFYKFGENLSSQWTTLDKDGFLMAVCGKPEYMLGTLHPIYPEVREEWLRLTKYCLDRGADGINFRAANHTRMDEFWEYGYNEPVLKASGGKTDFPTISKINGDAYTLFLRQARDQIKSRGKNMTIHLHTTMLKPDDRKPSTSLPPNFEWQWPTWVQEIGDEFELRGSFTLRPWHLDTVIEVFSKATNAARKPLYYQGDFHGMSMERPYLCTPNEIDRVNSDPNLAGFVMYETAYYTRLTDDYRIEKSQEMAAVVKKLNE